MGSLLSGLKGQDSIKKAFEESGLSEDSDETNIIGRRVSMNMTNEVGENFQQYLLDKPSPGVRREI